MSVYVNPVVQKLADLNAALADEGDSLLVRERIVEAIAEINHLGAALNNCRSMAMTRRRHGDAVSWDHVIRFCTEAGYGPRFIR